MQQYSFLFPALFIIWIVLVAARIGAYLDAKAKKEGLLPAIIPQKVCPMHDWKWVEQPGMEQETFYIKCQRCKKTPSQISEGN